MLANPTLEQFTALRLHGFAKAYREQLESTSYLDMSSDDRLGIMLEREVTDRQAAGMRRRVGHARFREQASIEDIRVSGSRWIDKSLLLQLQTCQWIKDKKNLIVTGASGVGKTYVATALAHKACLIGYSSRYFRANRISSELAESKAERKYKKTIERLGKIDVLILDDWLLSGINEDEQKDLFEIIEERNGRASTIITSQNPVATWHTLMPNAAIADALLDRLVHGAQRIELKGESMRKKISQTQDQVDKVSSAEK